MTGKKIEEILQDDCNEEEMSQRPQEVDNLVKAYQFYVDTVAFIETIHDGIHLFLSFFPFLSCIGSQYLRYS